MPTTLRTWLRAEHGASPVSLMAVVASLVIVAAIAVPALKSGASSASQTGQTAAATAAAADAQAQTLVETGQTAMATYAASNGSGYTGVSPSALSAIEPTLITASNTEAYIASASGTATGYTLMSVDPVTHDTFTLTDSAGATSRTCAPAGHGGCSASGTF